MVKQKVTLVAHTPDPLMAIESAAANCYNSTPSPDGKTMKQCYKAGHYSVLEFCDFTWHIEGISRALSHQLVRSRLASFAQRSQRYVSESDYRYITPDSIQVNCTALQEYNQLMKSIQCTYDYFVSLGIPQEDARSVLPNACETIIEVKMNLREFIHFCNDRLCLRSQAEIRQMCQKMRDTVLEVCPYFSEFLVAKCEIHAPYCFCTELKSCGKHKKLKDVISSGC